MTFARTLLFSTLIAGAPACSSPSSSTPPSGPSVYQNPLVDGNSFTCATCHALSEPSSDGLRRPGHPLGDATRRASWKNGKAKTFLDAVNSCVTEWMVGTAWSATDPRYLALYDYLDAQAPAGPAATLAFEVVQPPSDLSGGDATRGHTTFDQTCIVCHGAGGVGTDRGPRIAGSARLPSYVAARIRTSGPATSTIYDGLTGGVMPFWAKDRLSDGEVRDLVRFVTSRSSASDGGAAAGDGGSSEASGGSSGAADSGGVAGSGMAGSTGGGDSATGCAKTNRRIGWSADLGVNHGEGQVSGTVTMIDDCTLELRDFSYDGNGIDVRVYGSTSPNFKPGFSIGDDLVGHVFSKQTLRVRLPTGKTLDDLDWVSIWCVKAGANFGSGPFLAP